jgi:hypothetical protein
MVALAQLGVFGTRGKSKFYAFILVSVWGKI